MKRTIALLLCMAMLLSYLPSVLFSAYADSVIPEDGDINIEITPDDEVEETTEATEPEVTEPEVTEPETTEPETSTCAACGADVVWTPVANGTRISSANGTHFVLAENCTYSGTLPVISVEEGAAVCVDLNGYKITSTTEINVKGTLNIIGDGVVGGNIGGGAFGGGSQPDVDFDDLINAGQGGTPVAYDNALINIAGANAVVNIYGGTYSCASDKPIVAYTAAGSLNLLGGEVKGTVDAGNLSIGGAASAWRIEVAEAGKLTVKADWTGTAVANFAAAAVEGLIPAANAAAEGDFKGNLKTPQGRKLSNDNGQLRVKILENNPVQEAALDMTFPKDGSDYVAVCPACGVEVTWQAVTANRIYKSLHKTDAVNPHFYLANDVTIKDNNNMGTFYGAATEHMCIHLNGKTLDARGGWNASRGILSIMGNGMIKSAGNCTDSAATYNTGVIKTTHSGADVHIYGGTIHPYGATTYALDFAGKGSMAVYEGAYIDGKVNGILGDLTIEYGTVYGVQGELDWTFTNGDLTISGTGAMAGEEGKNVSWYAVNACVKNFYIGADITGMDDSALAGTTILEAFHVDEANAVYSDVNGVLYNKEQTELLMIPGNYEGEITIPATVTTIDEAAFYNSTKVTAINVDPANANYSSEDGILFNKEKTQLIRFPAKKAGTYTVPETVTSIAAYAFAYCEELTAVVVSDNVTEMGDYTFKNALTLSELTLSNNLTAIPAYMCQGCEAMTSAVIPEGVTAIGTYAFAKSGLEEITIPATVTEIGKFTFYGTPLTDVYYGADQEAWEAIAYEPNVATGVVDELEVATIHYTEAPVITLTGITVTAPTKVEYEIGETLVLDGMTVTATYSDETTAPVTEGYEVSGFESETAGVKTVTVTYEGFTATFEVTVKEPVVMTGIAVTKQPTKVTYMVGDAFNAAGMVVTATYSDGSTAAIKDYTVDADLSSAGTKTVTVTCGEFTATFTVEVLADVDMTIATANADAGITITWTAAGADKYQVYMSSLTDGVWSDWTALSTGTTSKTYTYKAAVAGTQYKFKVVALSGTATIGEIVSEPIARVTTPTPAVSNIMNGVQLTWTGTEGAEGYYIYRNERIDAATNTYGEWVKIGETTETTYVDETAVNGGRYSYMVRTLSGGSLSAEVAPSAGKRILRLEAVEVTTVNTVSGVRIDWTQNEFAPKYYLLRSAATIKDGSITWGAYTRIATLEGAYSYPDLTAKNGVLYRYAIQGINNTQQSCISNPSEIMRLSVGTATAANIANGIQVEWPANAGATAFNLYRSVDENGTWTAWGKPILVTTGTTYLDLDVVNGVRYRYMARPINDAYGTEYISGAKTGAIIYRLEQAIINLENTTSGIRAYWEKNSQASKYFIYRSTYENGAWTGWTKVGTTTTNTIEFVDTSTQNTAGTQYRYMVRIYKGTDQSLGKSSEPIMRIAFTNLSAAKITGGIKLTWKANVCAESYLVYRRVVIDATNKVYGEWEQILEAGSDVLTYTDTTVEKGVTYQYSARAVNGTNIGGHRASSAVTY